MRNSATILRSAYDAFIDDDGWAIASHIALSMLTSLFPFLIFLTSLAGFLGSKELADEAAALLFDAWPRQAAEPIAAEIHNVLTNTRGDLLTLSAALALLFSSSAIEALRIGLNRAYNVRDARPWWLLRMESVLYVLIGAGALLLLATAVIFAPVIELAAARYEPQWARAWGDLGSARLMAALTALSISLIVAHKWLPAGRRNMRDIAPGVLFTLVLSFGFALGFAQYIAEFARNYVSTYAGLASVMIALLFLYFLGVIFLFGGELNVAIMAHRQRDGRPLVQDPG